MVSRVITYPDRDGLGLGAGGNRMPYLTRTQTLSQFAKTQAQNQQPAPYLRPVRYS